MNNKTLLKNLKEEAITTAKKHWIVYIFPILFIAAGFYFINEDQTTAKAIGFVLLLSALLRVFQVSMVKWFLTPEFIVVQQGWPWSKKFHHIPVFELYKNDADPGKFSRFFNLATLTVKGREEFTDTLKHINISDAGAFSQEVAKVVMSSPAYPLNNAFALKEKGAISEEEYRLMKLGVVTQRYLG